MTCVAHLKKKNIVMQVVPLAWVLVLSGQRIHTHLDKHIIKLH